MFNTVCCDNDLYTPYIVLIVNYNRPREMKYARRLLSTLHTVRVKSKCGEKVVGK